MLIRPGGDPSICSIQCYSIAFTIERTVTLQYCFSKRVLDLRSKGRWIEHSWRRFFLLFFFSYVELPNRLLKFFNFNLCINSRHHQLILGLSDSIPKEKMFNFNWKFGNYVSEWLVVYAKKHFYIAIQLRQRDNPINGCSSSIDIDFHTGKCIRRFGGIYAYCRYLKDRKW